MKLTPGADAAASLSATLLRLSDAGFSWKRTESRDATGLVTLTGTLPQHSVARVMADASVVRVEPVGEGGASKPAPMPAPDAKSYLEWFSRHPIVLLVGLLIPLAGRVLRPYDR
ncbi:MAG: hypothetical protein NTX64_11740 [Elusimicrobia bacterium]|nr:hypothetical protein [Elusimicrobiota bacterium]